MCGREKRFMIDCGLACEIILDTKEHGAVDKRSAPNSKAHADLESCETESIRETKEADLVKYSACRGYHEYNSLEKYPSGRICCCCSTSTGFQNLANGNSRLERRSHFAVMKKMFRSIGFEKPESVVTRGYLPAPDSVTTDRT